MTAKKGNDSNSEHPNEKGIPTQDFSKLEIALAQKVIQETSTPPISKLTKHVNKQQQVEQFTRLGVHGIFSMLLSLFAPLFMRARQHKTSNYINRQINNDK